MLLKKDSQDTQAQHRMVPDSNDLPNDASTLLSRTLHFDEGRK